MNWVQLGLNKKEKMYLLAYINQIHIFSFSHKS